MRRRMWTIAICVIGGLLLTLFSAWALALAHARWDLPSKGADLPLEWPASVPSDWTTVPIDAGVAEGSGRTLFMAREPIRNTWIRYMNLHEFGWPMRSMYFTDGFALSNWQARTPTAVQPPMPRVDSPEWREGFLVRVDRLPGAAAWPFGPARLPTSVLPLGFVVNWLSFAAALFCAVLVLQKLGKLTAAAVRRRRGLCGGCGYEIGDLVVCPECGSGRP